MFFHATNPTLLFEEEVDQIATVGFEMFIYSFGSGFNVSRVHLDILMLYDMLPMRHKNLSLFGLL